MGKAALLARLREEIGRAEGRAVRLSPESGAGTADDLWRFGGAALDSRFPAGLGLAALHELSPDQPAHWASAAAIAVRLVQRLPLARAARPLLWVQGSRSMQERGHVSAAHLAATGLALERLVFLEVRKPADALWALEEGLQTPALAAVVAAGIEIGFTASRRLSLACAASGVPLLHLPEVPPGTTAAATRWTVSPRPSAPDLLVPQAVGPPRWRLSLTRARQDVGIAWPTSFEVEWDDATLCFDMVAPLASGPVAALPPVLTGATLARAA
jgi:protein ImuA